MADNQTIETIKAVGAIVTPIVLAWIAFLQIKSGHRQVKADAKQEEIHRQINGMKEALIIAEKGKSKLEGKEEQRAEDKVSQVVVAQPVQDVKIVDQVKPVEVVTKTKTK